MSTVFWPRDVLYDGYFYGWIKHHTVCVAGVLKVHSRVDADEALATALQSKDIQDILALCGTPIVLGYATFSSSSPSAFPNMKDDTVQGSLIKPYRFIHYHRHAASSMRFYANDDDPSTVTPALNDLQTPMETSLVYDFTHNKSTRLKTSEYQLIINQWNAAKSLEETVESNRAKGSRYKESRNSSQKLARTNPRAARSSLVSVLAVLSGVTAKLKEFSFTARQIEGRGMILYQLAQWRFEPNGIPAQSSHAYNRHYNSVWVILNDLIIGLAFRQFLCQNRDILNVMVADGLESTLALRIQHVLLWLDSWPAGLKLNTELSRFYSRGFISLITQWTDLLHHALSLLPTLSFLMETACLLGMTMTLSLSLDLISILTAHLHVCYFISSTIYRHVLLLIGSLWNLFRGKRYNPLRNRTDPWDYDVDQLLLGTILFTLAAHLFPTILVYYALFALMRLVIIVLYASCETLLAFMNHFPLFALMLRTKDPQRLPGDAYLQVVKTPQGCLVTVESHPLPFAAVFTQYAGLWQRLARHYHPIRLGKRLLQGHMLDTFPQASITTTSDH